MSDHEPPTSLDKPPPGDDHASIPTRVTRLEVLVYEVILRLDKLDTKVDRLADKIDAVQQEMNKRFNKIYFMIFAVLTALISGLLGLLAKVLGVI
jgi:hypothetical protein